MASMPIPLTLVLSMAAGLCSTMCIKLFAKKCSDGIGSTFVFNGVSIVTAAILLLIWCGSLLLFGSRGGAVGLGQPHLIFPPVPIQLLP